MGGMTLFYHDVFWCYFGDYHSSSKCKTMTAPPNHQGPLHHLQNQDRNTTFPDFSKRLSKPLPFRPGTCPVSLGLSYPVAVAAIGPPSPLFFGCGFRPSGNARGRWRHQWKGLTMCVHDLSQILWSECIENSNELEQCFSWISTPFVLDEWKLSSKAWITWLWTRQLVCICFIFLKSYSYAVQKPLHTSVILLFKERCFSVLIKTGHHDLNASKRLVPITALVKPGAEEIKLVLDVHACQALRKSFPVQALPGEFIPLLLVTFTLVGVRNITS